MKPELDVPINTEWQKKQISYKRARRISITAVKKKWKKMYIAHRITIIFK